MTQDELDTEQKILAAAHTVFFQRGTAGARMQEIADEAGVNKALLHYYFRSKDRLADAVFLRAAQRLMPPLLVIMGSDAPIEEKVVKAVHHYLDVLSEAPYLPGYILAELHHHPDRMKRMMSTVAGNAPGGFAREARARLAPQIAARVEAGTMRPIDPDQFVVNLISLCIFPFPARPMFEFAFGWGPEDFAALIEKRRAELPAFFLAALRP